MRSLLPLRSLTVKLGLVVFGLVFLVIAVLLLAVVPRLESRVVDARLDRLERAAPLVERELRRLSAVEIQEGSALAVLGTRHDARIVVLTPLSAGSLTVATHRSGRGRGEERSRPHEGGRWRSPRLPDARRG